MLRAPRSRPFVKTEPPRRLPCFRTTPHLLPELQVSSEPLCAYDFADQAPVALMQPPLDIRYRCFYVRSPVNTTGEALEEEARFSRDEILRRRTPRRSLGDPTSEPRHSPRRFSGLFFSYASIFSQEPLTLLLFFETSLPPGGPASTNPLLRVHQKIHPFHLLVDYHFFPRDDRGGFHGEGAGLVGVRSLRGTFF